MALVSTNSTQEEDLLRLPPQALEAEQSILGSMMLDNRVIDEISSELETRDFYRSDHQAIFSESEAWPILARSLKILRTQATLSLTPK